MFIVNERNSLETKGRKVDPFLSTGSSEVGRSSGSIPDRVRGSVGSSQMAECPRQGEISEEAYGDRRLGEKTSTSRNETFPRTTVEQRKSSKISSKIVRESSATIINDRITP